MEKELILGSILGKKKEHFFTWQEPKLTRTEQKKYSAALKKLAAGYPLAYILGSRWFYKNEFRVNKNVLIPRPETEQLLELAISYAKLARPKIICDIGTGSGAIIISLKKALPKSKALFLGTDISKKALALARLNARQLKTRSIVFKQGGLLASLKSILKKQNTNILIAANLPYLSKKELSQKTIRHEPRLALYGGKYSEELIEKLLLQIAELNLVKSAIILEINDSRSAKLKKFAAKLFPKSKIEIKKDLKKRDRFLTVKF